MKQIIPASLYDSIKDILQQARTRAYYAANSSMVLAYWDTGRLIVENEQAGQRKAAYGKAIIKELSTKLTRDFGPGFSEQGLRNYRQFFLTFPNRSTLRSVLTWSHYKALIRVSNAAARNYYLTEATTQQWTVRTLERHIHSLYYERLLHSPDKKSLELEMAAPPMQPRDILKDPLVLEFLDLPSHLDYKEKDMEKAIIGHLQHFMLELGKGFAFVGRQQYIRTENSDFFIDLVFYNCLLKCYVLIDIKMGALTHQDIGQMDMYVRMYETFKKAPDDNPTIGIILCSEKDQAVVKFSVLQENRQLFATRYMLYLPTEEELQQLIETDRSILEEAMATYNTWP
ncbi:MAG TPA: PDDEXK nuclease domain-containing protein [Puia sp.]|jgi:predicted nuclease of restriction endonuclease-like (RecB) superfamily|nr:PDDEXK nuclease domain-containing protein [Puia sp.]